MLRPARRLVSALFIVGVAFLLYGWYGGISVLNEKRPETNQIPAAPQKVSQPVAQKAEEKVITTPENFLVTRVIDGDTIELETGSKVRYIGMDTPETVDPDKPVQCFGKEASERNKELVEGKRVQLVKDISETDRYGRLLRYVYLPDGTMVNLELVQEGYARVETIPPDVKYSSIFIVALREARLAKRGLWAACS